jgi:thiol-disulfide isomerase/thioredoxin
MKIAAAVVTLAVILQAQQPTPAGPPENESQLLQQALADAGSSQVDFARAIDRHLERFPKSAQRPELERAAARAAMEARDAGLIIKFGERILARDPQNLEILERVSRYLLATDEEETSRRALEYASRLENMVSAMGLPAAGTRGAGRFAEERLILLGKSQVYRARALGNLGKHAEAVASARKSFDTFPSAEGAREIARWLEKSGKIEEALPHLADAFMIPDPNATEEDRRKDRKRLGEWYARVKGSEKGMGDLLVAAYDRTIQRVDSYRAALKAADPNAGADDVMEFTITGLAGDKLEMSSLAGKVVVLDFWATWCGPCRAQQPLYEEVKERFKDHKDVVFLNINTDENRALVKPFLDREKWNKTVYFEDGLSALLRVSSIPTTVIVGKNGKIASRMNGYVPERFVEVLSERIHQLVKEN